MHRKGQKQGMICNGIGQGISSPIVDCSTFWALLDVFQGHREGPAVALTRLSSKANVGAWQDKT